MTPSDQKIRTVVDAFVRACLLRAHVVRGAHRLARLRRFADLVLRFLRDPEIEDLHDLVVVDPSEEHVGRLEIPVDDPAMCAFRSALPI